jgi:hypothetical protein
MGAAQDTVPLFQASSSLDADGLKLYPAIAAAGEGRGYKIRQAQFNLSEARTGTFGCRGNRAWNGL